MDHPRLSPSIMFLMTLCLALLFSWLNPWHISFYVNVETVRLIGVSILFISLTINMLAYRIFKKHITPYAPFSKPKVLIQKGIFAFSRNPVYLALVLSQLGLGFILDSVWVFLTTTILLGLLHFIIVLDEEKVLKNNFKDEYRLYIKKTRRWC